MQTERVLGMLSQISRWTNLGARWEFSFASLAFCSATATQPGVHTGTHTADDGPISASYITPTALVVMYGFSSFCVRACNTGRRDSVPAIASGRVIEQTR